MDRNIHVSISGRNEIVREGLRLILMTQEFQVQSVVSDASALLEGEGTKDNHVIIVDLVTDSDELEVCRNLRSRFPKSRIVVMAENCSVGSVVNAFDVGIDGFLEKTISCEPLGHAIKLIALGHKVLPTSVVDLLTNHHFLAKDGELSVAHTPVGLSDREFDILRCLVRGITNKVIGRQLDITEATVKVHIKAILRKLNLDNRTQAAIWAVNHKLVDAPLSGTFGTERTSVVASLEL